MSAFLTVIHVIVCLVLIIAVLLQSGKAADLAGAFGGAGSQTVFGPRGAATILSKVTTISAVLFMVTSFGLYFLSTGAERSAVSGVETEETQPADPGAKTEAQPPGEKKEAAAQPGDKKAEKKAETTEKKDPAKKAPEKK